MSLWLITGGAGFIGSNIVAHLCRAGHDVVVADTLGDASTGKWRNLLKHPIRDIVHPTAVMAWLERHGADVDGIIHMGAISATTASDVDEIVQTNFTFSRCLWNLAVQVQKPLIYASSAATYGDGSHGFSDEGGFEAHLQLMPLNAYGYSKKLFDLYVLNEVERGRATPPQWAGLKFFNVYGPNEYHKGPMQSVVAQIAPKVQTGAAIELFKSHNPDYADGGQLRDFVSVRDVVRVIDWLMATPSVSGVYNLGSGQARSFADLTHATAAAMGRVADIRYIDMPEAIRKHYQYFTEAKMDKLRAAGYPHAMLSLEDGVADYVQRYLMQPDPYL